MNKCTLKNCLQNQNGKCTLKNPFTYWIKPSSIKCKFLDTDFEKSWNDYKFHGGTVGALRSGRGFKSEKELKNIKKSKRKPRSDKGKKRGPKKKKKTNTLEDMI